MIQCNKVNRKLINNVTEKEQSESQYEDTAALGPKTPVFLGGKSSP